jgi:rRNA maturation endonuclease Nob1
MATFRVRAELTFVNGDRSQPFSFAVEAEDKDDARRRVTKDYIMQNVSDDWGVPIRNVTVIRVQETKVMKA